MYNKEIIDMLLKQIEERDEMIKSISNNTSNIIAHHEDFEKNKSKLHRNTLLFIILSFTISITIIVCTFIIAYFTCDFEPAQINGNGNITNNDIGNDNTIESKY